MGACIDDVPIQTSIYRGIFNGCVQQPEGDLILCCTTEFGEKANCLLTPYLFFFTPYHFLIFDMRFWYWTWTKLLAKGQMVNHKPYVESHCSLVQRVLSRRGGTFEVIMRWYNVGFTYVLDSLNQLFKALLYDRSWIRPSNSWDHCVYLRSWSHWKRTTNENPIYTRW